MISELNLVEDEESFSSELRRGLLFNPIIYSEKCGFLKTAIKQSFLKDRQDPNISKNKSAKVTSKKKIIQSDDTDDVGFEFKILNVGVQYNLELLHLDSVEILRLRSRFVKNKSTQKSILSYTSLINGLAQRFKNDVFNKLNNTHFQKDYMLRSLELVFKITLELLCKFTDSESLLNDIAILVINSLLNEQVKSYFNLHKLILQVLYEPSFKVNQDLTNTILLIVTKEICTIYPNYSESLDSTIIKSCKNLKPAVTKNGKVSFNMFDMAKGANEFQKYEQLTTIELKTLIHFYFKSVNTRLTTIDSALHSSLYQLVIALNSQIFTKSLIFMNEEIIKEFAALASTLLISKNDFFARSELNSSKEQMHKERNTLMLLLKNSYLHCRNCSEIQDAYKEVQANSISQNENLRVYESADSFFATYNQLQADSTN